MRSTDEQALVADIEQLSEIQFPGYSQRCPSHRAKLYAATVFVGLLSSTSLVSRADVLYKIVDSRGTVTYSEHAPTIPGNFTVTKINKQTGAVISDKSKGTKPEPPAPAPEQRPAPSPEQPPAPPSSGLLRHLSSRLRRHPSSRLLRHLSSRLRRHPSSRL